MDSYKSDKKKDHNRPLVSVRIITYNHELFIGKCLESIINQKTNFVFEIVIGEDCSTDNTRQIINRYQNLHPELIKVITSEENVGPFHNGIRTTRACIGKYIANCDGDDYWLVEDKLQKQVDFLEQNPDYGLVFSDIDLVDQRNKAITNSHYHINQKLLYKSGDIFWSLLERNFINMSTVCYLRESINGIFPKNYEEELKCWYITDYFIWLHVASNYKIEFINEKMATYRSHSQNLTLVSNFLSRRNPMLIYKICTGIDCSLINTTYKKEIYFKKFIGIIRNNNAPLRIRLGSLWKLLRLPFTCIFLFKKVFQLRGD